ncbi:sensor histidine kinase [Spirosoma koreense]
MRTGMLLLTLFSRLLCLAQSTVPIDYEPVYRQRMANLSPVQRFEWAVQYGHLLNEQSRFAEARALMQQSLKAAQQTRLPSWQAFFHERLGHLALTAGNPPQALASYLQALHIYQTTNQYDWQQIICQDISGIYTLLQNKTKANEYRQRAIQLRQQYNQLLGLWSSFSTEVDRLVSQGQLDSALVVNKKALTALLVNREWVTYHSALDGYGVLLAQVGQDRQAEQTLRQCLAYSLQQDDHRRELYAYMHLPLPLLHLHRLTEAEQYAKRALSRIEKDPERQDEHRAEVYAVLTQIAQAKGNYRQALDYERLHNQFATRLLSAEKSRQLAEVETRYQTAQKQARIDQLSTANQIQTTQISWQAAGLLALIMLLSLTLWQYRVIRRVNARLLSTNQTVTENNQQIREQAEKLSVLMRELHHRVKNNLAIVSSLLRMQSKRLDDPHAVQAVQDGQRRVEAISLIHQQFYQTDNLADVPIKAYVTELTEGLLVGYGFDLNQFDCQIEVADLQLDVEVAVPLGLILNEVLTNAFKYAYSDMTGSGQTRPYLRVVLQPDPAQSDGSLLVEVQDNGPGLAPADQRLGETRGPAAGKRSSFGQRLIRELTGQLDGEMTLTAHNGTCFQLRIPAPHRTHQVSS